MGSNFWNWISPPGRSRELKETYDLLAEVQAKSENLPIEPGDKANDFIYAVILESCEERGVVPSIPLGGALFQLVWDLLCLEGFIVDLPDPDINIDALSVDEAVALRKQLRQHIRFLSDHKRLLGIWRQQVVEILDGILEYFPSSVFIDPIEGEASSDDSVILPEAAAYDICDDLPEILDRLIITLFDLDLTATGLFDGIRERLERNFLFASGIPYERRHEAHPSKIVFPSRQRMSREMLVETYLQGTPFAAMFESGLPFSIPFPARFEHTHVLGGTGHGKTQLLQFFIHHDLVRSQSDGRSVVVIDSQGDLIRTISQLETFSPSVEGSLEDRLVLIDPNDVEYPVRLNMFDFNRDRLASYAPVNREKILNATVELYEYFFGALLGAELTQRQGLIFRYLARLMLEIPDANIHTLRHLMEDGEAFRPFMERLQGTARSFFETRFFDRQFNETKKQILTRLWGVLSNSTLERMFSHQRNKVDVFELLNQGKIILINTAKDLLGQEGAEIFGRFFICLIAQAAVQRAVLAPHERRPGFIYIDEAQDYFDDNISHLLNQARKYRLGLIFAHQNLDQLSAGLRSSVLASTSIKFAGGLSAKDASTVATEMRCLSEFLLSQRKRKEHTEFACFVKNLTSSALSVQIPLGYVENLPTLSYEEHQQLITHNRAQYSAPPMIAPPPPRPAATSRSSRAEAASPTPDRHVPPREREAEIQFTPRQRPPDHPSHPIDEPEMESVLEGRVRVQVEKRSARGTQHRYLQSLIKNLAEGRGFRAVLEETVLDGTGRVDVSVTSDAIRAAFEISVTTDGEQELSNIEKCFAAGYTHIFLVGDTERHVKKLASFIEENLEEPLRGRVAYLGSAALPDAIEQLPMAIDDRKTVRGYKVKVSRQVLSQDELEAKRAAIAKVIAQSLNRTGA